MINEDFDFGFLFKGNCSMGTGDVARDVDVTDHAKCLEKKGACLGQNHRLD